MKRRLLMTMMAMVLAFSFTGCGNKKADETTATTEAASEVKDEFIKFVGTDIPKMDTEEAEIDLLDQREVLLSVIFICVVYHILQCGATKPSRIPCSHLFKQILFYSFIHIRLEC